MNARFIIPTFLAALLIITGCSRNPVTGKREVMFMSESQEIAMGKQYDPSIVANYGLYEDDQLQQFITEKGKAMAAISHRPNLNYEFKILDSPMINAFAVPGGYVYFTRGIMAHFNNEAEFAGVLGHEIGHITARHSAKQYSKQMLANIGFIGGIIVSEDFRRYAQQAQQALGLLFMKFSRDHERQSDELGVDYSSAIGYDAVKMAEFYKTLQRVGEKSGGNRPTFLSTHPNPANRYQDVTARAQRLQSEKPGNYAVNREKYLRMIDGIIYGEDPKQGFLENNVFYHPVLKFQFDVPNGWQFKNTPTIVQMAPKEGKALISFALSKGNTPQEAARTFAQENKLSVIDSSPENVNGFNGYALIAEQQSGNQQTGQTKTLRLLCYFIQKGDMIYRMVGVADNSQYSQYHRLFQNVMLSFRNLSDPDKINRKPTVLKIKKVMKGGTLRSILQDYNMPSSLHNDISILNGMNLDDQVDAGSLVKLLINGRSKGTSTSTKSRVPGNANTNTGNDGKIKIITPNKTSNKQPSTNQPTKKSQPTKKTKVIKLKKVD